MLLRCIFLSLDKKTTKANFYVYFSHFCSLERAGSLCAYHYPFESDLLGSKNRFRLCNAASVYTRFAMLKAVYAVHSAKQLSLA